MLTEVDISLLVGAVIVALLSWPANRRGILWISVAALSYINATIAWRLEVPYAEAITGMGDAGVCLAVYFFGRQRWEMMIWRLFQTSVAISFIYLAGNIDLVRFLRVPHDAYSIMMEAINWLLLLLVGSISALQLIGARDVGARRPWHRVRGLALALGAQRTRAPFTSVH